MRLTTKRVLGKVMEAAIQKRMCDVRAVMEATGLSRVHARKELYMLEKLNLIKAVGADWRPFEETTQTRAKSLKGN